MDSSMKRSWSLFLLTSGISLAIVSGCSSRIDQRGKLPESEKLAQIKAGHDTKEDVLRLIGSPTNSNVFDDYSWCYIHKTTETTSFLEPKILDQEIIVIEFDSAGLVKEIRHEDGQGKALQPVKRITPAAGQEQSALQKIFGNFGRFSKKDKKE